MGTIEARGLGKAYKRYPRRADRLLEWLGFGTRHQRHWVLQDVGFTIRPGESVGIVGANGAGKSTLLKMIAGVLQPTTGTVTATGRVAALLELGMGFQPEFTGRQNVRMSGLLAGMTNDEIDRAMPGIEAFADIGDYLDEPVRTYSSGMQVRLAFSVATAVRPDVLIVDEALAVGDVFFQQKCFARIREFLSAGTTLLFVSHSAATVYALCERAILIDGGRIALDGSAREVLDLYNALVAARSGSGRHRVAIAGAGGETGAVAPDEGGTACEAGTGADPRGSERPLSRASPSSPTEGVKEARGGPALPPERSGGAAVGGYAHAGVAIESVELFVDGAPAQTLVSGATALARITVRFGQRFDDPHVGFQVRDRRGEAVFMTHTHAMRQRVGVVEPGETVTVDYRFDVPLAPGEYTLTTGVADGGLPGGTLADSIARIQDALAFQVVARLHDIQWNGLCNLRPTVSIRRAGRAPDVAHPILVTTSHSLLLFDTDTGRARPLHRGAGLYYGIAFDGPRVLVGARRRLVSSPVPAERERGAILVFDRDLVQIDTWEAPFPLRDIHEIAVHQGTLWVTCAFDNLVALRHPDGRWEAWYPLGRPEGPQRDVNHFNSMAFTEGRFHLLAHNRGASERLEFDLADRRLLARAPLGQQSHNLWRRDGEWVACSSGEGRLVGDAGLDVSTGGFPRGLVELPGGRVAVGVSELAERQRRDFTTGRILVFEAGWRLAHDWPLPDEGLVLDLRPAR